MLKRTLLSIVLFICVLHSNAQLNLNLLDNYVFPPSRGDCSDIWGYVDGSGNEYAIVGNNNGTSIMDVTVPTNPVEVFFSPGPSSIWRDIKVWGTTAYITNETSGGLKIIDMSALPGAITAGDVSNYSGSTYPFTKAHDFFVDENGVGFVLGADNGVGGAIILDLFTDQLNPVELGRYNDYYLHDAFVRGDTMWGGAVYDGFFAVIDVSNPAATTTMATHFTPDNFTHNCWLSDDGNTLYTTDEVSDAYITSYDVSDIMNISELDRIQSNPGSGTIPHNTFVIGDFLVTSYYRDGVTIHDATYPGNMIEVGNYDTAPTMSGDGFNGCWGVYPYLPSGNIIAADIETGLYVFGPTYVQAAYLNGNITDAVTTNPIDGAQAEILLVPSVTNSDVLGDYETGAASAGTYDVLFSHPGYVSQTISNVVLVNGSITIQDVALQPIATFTLQGQVLDAGSSPIINANVRITNASFDFNVTTNGLGNFTVPNFIDGNYDVYVGKWAYIPMCVISQSLTVSGGPYIYQLDDGYADDFALDLGWSVSGNPDTGDWERDVPVGTTSGGDQSNPGVDAATDCGDQAFITGNAGGSAGNDDIDNGETVLNSPIFDLSTYTDPYIHFERWFFNDGGSGAPNDSMVIVLSNGTTSATIDFAVDNDPAEGTWASKSFKILDFISPTSLMQVKVRAMDIGPGHLVEGGFDNFMITDSTSSSAGIEIDGELIAVSIYPSPFNEELNISLTNSVETIRVEVYEMTSGRFVASNEYKNSSDIVMKNNYARGVYLIHVFGNGELIKTQRVIKI